MESRGTATLIATIFQASSKLSLKRQEKEMVSECSPLMELHL